MHNHTDKKETPRNIHTIYTEMQTAIDTYRKKLATDFQPMLSTELKDVKLDIKKTIPVEKLIAIDAIAKKKMDKSLSLLVMKYAAISHLAADTSAPKPADGIAFLAKDIDKEKPVVARENCGIYNPLFANTLFGGTRTPWKITDIIEMQRGTPRYGAFSWMDTLAIYLKDKPLFNSTFQVQLDGIQTILLLRQLIAEAQGLDPKNKAQPAANPPKA